MPQRTFLMMLIVVCVTILCFVWLTSSPTFALRDSGGGFPLVGDG
ncbi:Hok/Gef family protein (plasmid) [Salmonella enterica subsp. enterica serovar Enteritidis]